jgi:hypothetical protein
MVLSGFADSVTAQHARRGRRFSKLMPSDGREPGINDEANSMHMVSLSQYMPTFSNVLKRCTFNIHAIAFGTIVFLETGSTAGLETE